MSIKLFKLRRHLKIEDTALYLSEGIGGEVSCGEVIRLVLNKYLEASIILNNLEFGRYGKRVDSKTGASICYRLFGGFLELDEEVTSNTFPLFDLPMIGKEVDILKGLFREYSSETIDHSESFCMTESVILRDDDDYFELFEEYDRNHKFSGSEASFEQMFEGGFQYSSHVTEGMRIDNQQDRALFLNENTHVYKNNNVFVPAISLPDHSTLVFKIEELDRFIREFHDKGDQTDTGSKAIMMTREKNTLLVLIAALCKQANFDYSQRGISKAIEAATEELGARIGDDTIRKILKEIPEALESRQK